MTRYAFTDRHVQLVVRSWEFVAGPNDEENMGQIVVISVPAGGAAQRQSVTRLSVQIKMITLYPN